MRVLLAAFVLGGVFGSASATVESVDDGVMVVSIEVEVAGSPDTVVAHLSFEDDEPLTLPLLDRGGGLFGLRTELEPKNYFVVFEVVGQNAESSDPVSLVQLGAELGPGLSGGTATTIDGDQLSDDSQRMLWLAVAFGAGSLSLLAFWVLGGRDEDEGGDEADNEAGEDGDTVVADHSAGEEE